MSTAFDVDDVVPAAAGLALTTFASALEKTLRFDQPARRVGRRPCWRTPGQAAGKSFVPAAMGEEDVRRAAAGSGYDALPPWCRILFRSRGVRPAKRRIDSRGEAKRHGERHQTDGKGQNHSRIRPMASGKSTDFRTGPLAYLRKL